MRYGSGGGVERALPRCQRGFPAPRKRLFRLMTKALLHAGRGFFGSMGGMRTRSGGGFMGEGNGVGGVARRSPAH